MIHGSVTELPLENETVDCIVTSPPYNVGAFYDDVDDALTASAYHDLASLAAIEMRRVLKPGGRVWLNVVQTTNQMGDYGRHTGVRFSPLSIWLNALGRSGLLYRDIVVWNKMIGNQATAWGSYLSPNAPNLRGRWEPILLYFKDHWSRARDDGPNDIDPDEWTILTNNVWTFPADGANRWHPAPFPAELPRRAILLSTWPGDLILDPFAGAGTTLNVAHQLGRDAIGIELSKPYVRRWVDRGVQETLL